MSPSILPSFRPHQVARTACAALLTALPLSHASDAPDHLLVVHDTGRLIVNSNLTVNGGDVIIEGGGVMEVNTGSVTTATNLQVYLNGLLTGCGTINANVINAGKIEAKCGTGTYLIVNGNLTNNGTTEISNCTELQVSGTLLNDVIGTLDTRGGSMTAGTFTDNGTYFFGAGLVPGIELVSFGIVDADYVVTATTLSTKSYVMEVNTDLEPTGWVVVGFPQDGIDGPLIFTHTNGATTPGGKAFYRIREVPAP